ncbi:UDP-glucose 4-epimerase [Streptococcus parauberis]|uniref:NAD-dependent epimerase n=2 Tax=Streptococcus parauberis TaxID=1348 RepID=A0A0S3TFX8_9STRE|nr:NAD-dependent epimerase/dehydratase family protein [Streptococcus parauberis]AUT06286.1 UDP-glucose 4-epimerase [Streptococcus parauberis]EMG25705.1 UDP-glucose 4-epimerase [Streptococcus parauberis KRS-02083]UWV09675.1 NAD-dependent epimerase/dehydratase family protein [Streptococcus parauberis]WEM61992.1 NAD-dependent epimerase/dehydratase family protein [Streptococcus parauberis]WEM64376.1 NAD-dependent epimerase/dehydratase family protein [Streptococcus parauberis]
MKKILITGANSYIGQSLENWLDKSQGDYQVDTLDMINPAWKEYDFSPYDSIFHVAAIVHKNEKNLNQDLYDKVNRDLPIDIANLAKQAGVKQFIFLSSMSVYGNEEENITINTATKPSTYYGKSKLAAENGLKKLADDSFNLLILRPPMVYGPNATGNYTRLSKLSKLTVAFPKINNNRSMIFIDNLMEFIKQAIDRELSGLSFPQNKEYVTTSTLVKTIRQANGKKTLLTSIFNPILNQLTGIGQFNKLFGNLVYDQGLSQEAFDYNVVNFEESIRKSEKI